MVGAFAQVSYIFGVTAYPAIKARNIGVDSEGKQRISAVSCAHESGSMHEIAYECMSAHAIKSIFFTALPYTPTLSCLHFDELLKSTSSGSIKYFPAERCTRKQETNGA